MNPSRPPRRSTAFAEWERPARQSYPPRSNGSSSGNKSNDKPLILSALAVLLVVVVVGTTALVLRDLRLQAPLTATTLTMTIPATTAVKTTPTPDLRDPANNGWTFVTPAKFGDVQFAPSSSQRGYLCGVTPDGQSRVFGTTTNGGQTWATGASPAAYPTCNIHISPTNALDLTLFSINAPGDGNSTYVDAHYSTDGGATWKAAPFPQNSLGGGGAGSAWSGEYVYVWTGADKSNGQQGFLKVSANGGAFTSVDESTMLPGASSILIASAVVSTTRIFLNIHYSGCAAQFCEAIVASGDGGQSWTQIPNQSNIFLTAIVGNTLIGAGPAARNGQPGISTSIDNGSTWKPMDLPLLPNNTVAFDGVVVAPDQTIFVTSSAGVSYLRNGAWTTFKVSSSDLDSIQISAVSLGSNGQPRAVWGHDDGNHAGVYWHALP